MADELKKSGSSRSSLTDNFRNTSNGVQLDDVEEHDEQSLKWAAQEKLPTYDRLRKGFIKQVLENGKVETTEVDIDKLGVRERKLLLESIFRIVEEDNERFLKSLRERIDRVALELPKIEVRYENLSVEAEVYAGSRALPTLWNTSINTLEGIIGYLGLSHSKKRTIKILDDVSGILKPTRMALLLGPPASGKTTLLLALAAKLDEQLRVSGKVTYCGHELSEFIPQRTCAYISQHDVHNGEMTVRETLDFSARCLGVGAKHEMMLELLRREKEAGIKPDPTIDAFMKATAVKGQKTSVATDYVIKVLGLDICADIFVGDELRRGISGGEKKRVTIGEMLTGPAKVLFMDGISTGLDSSTTFQIVKYIRQMVHIMDATVLISLLQPAPETFELFDDVILLSEGQIVYQGPREHAVEFFEFAGFRCPQRKGVADFLQEVTSRKDQEQYWSKRDQPYRYISVPEFVQLFKSFHVGKRCFQELQVPYDKSKTHPAALVTERYGISNWELVKACLSREWLLMKRNSFVYIFKMTQITIVSIVALSVFIRTEMHHNTIFDGDKYLAALFFTLLNVMFNGYAELLFTIAKLPVFYKQRDFLFFPSWAFSLSYVILKIPLSFLESGSWIIITYYSIGFAPAAGRFFRQFLALLLVHQAALALFRFIAAVGRSMVIAITFGFFVMLIFFVLGGFVVSKDDIQPWWLWGFWISPLMYGQNAIAVNEFLDPRWGHPNNDSNINADTVGVAVLKSRGLFVHGYWYWIAIGALIGFIVLYNLLFVLALAYLNPIGRVGNIIPDDKKPDYKNKSSFSSGEIASKAPRNGSKSFSVSDIPAKRGMVLPFPPLSLTFEHVNYYVDMPAEMKKRGINEERLRLLSDVSGVFRPGVLTALVGVSGAGKTTLMDVLAGRKTAGYIEGNIRVSGYPMKPQTFARICGYCEQNDIHSPFVTVYESLLFSAWLRLPSEIDKRTREMFVEEVMDLVELDVLRDAQVGLPGVAGLSTEQRKRLTIAVELVSNPSIIFMDEPTTGLDARAAAIVMRTVRNTVDTGRTVVCTIHQPSIDIFEAFDELLLMKKGGQVIYAGELGRHSHKLIEYFEAIPGIPKIVEGCNPATWMLEVTTSQADTELNLDFAEHYKNSALYQQNQELIKELSIPGPNSKDLSFPTKYSQNFTQQYIACFWKQYWSYWRNPEYNGARLFATVIIGLLFGTMFWQLGGKISNQQDLFNLLGFVYSAVMFLGSSNAIGVMPVVAVERTVFYRERSAGMYSSFAYAFGQVTVEFIYIVAQGTIYTLLLFSMLGFKWTAEDFFWFLFFILMCFLYFALYGMMVAALTPDPQVGVVFSSFLLVLWNLFSGFLIPRPSIPIWWRWYYWANPVAWTIYGIISSQLGNKDSLIQIPGQNSTTVKSYLEDNLDFKHDWLGYAALVHVGFILVFFLVFVYSIKYLNFQKR